VRIRFDDQVVIVTGAGQGLGRAYAIELASRGAAVVVNDLGAGVDGSGQDRSKADAVVREIRARGGRAVPSHESVSTPEGGQAITDAAIEAFGRVDAVINNAGIIRHDSFEDVKHEDLNALFDVHAKGAFYVSQPAYRIMQKQNYGRLVFTSSNGGLFGGRSLAAYGAAKAALIGLANVLALEGVEAGILANTVMPLARGRMSRPLTNPSPELEAYRAAIEPELVSPLVVYLASADCTVTKHIFSAAAGRYARVFIGMNNGWLASDGASADADAVLDHLDDIIDLSTVSVPQSLDDERSDLIRQLGLAET
jgi:NAD(P)-dependent dehydrogenase (short-subunit alcohol dehydrogenase family)